MRCYLIDEMLKADINRIAAALDDLGLRGGLDGVYYLPVPDAHLTDVQREHLAECGPYIMALETNVPPEAEEGNLKLELLVRARNKLRCGCLAYAAPALERHMIAYLEGFIAELGIRI